MRIGIGYDIHRIQPCRPLILGGVDDCVEEDVGVAMAGEACLILDFDIKVTVADDLEVVRGLLSLTPLLQASD
jgi:hypothetical protein